MEPSTDFESTIKQDSSSISFIKENDINETDYLQNSEIIITNDNKVEKRKREEIEEEEENNNTFNIVNSDSHFNTNLTIYKKPIMIYDEFNKKPLRFEPAKYSMKEKYAIKETVYECNLAPTKVYIGEDIKTGEQVAIKETNKSKMGKDIYTELILNELAISKYLSTRTNSVVHVYDYFEEDESYIIVMELCDRPNFFEELLENVS